MKRQIFATFLSLCLLVGLLPTVALATNDQQEETTQSISTDPKEDMTTWLQNQVNNSNGSKENPAIIEIRDSLELTTTLKIPDGKYVEIVGVGNNITISPANSFTSNAFATALIEVGSTETGEALLNLKNITLDGNEVTRGIAVHRAQYLNLNNVVIKNGRTGTAASGGAIMVSWTSGSDGPYITMTDVEVFNCQAGLLNDGQGKYGGVINMYATGSLTLHDVNFHDNAAAWGGSSAYNSNIKFSGSIIAGKNDLGGKLGLNNCTLTLIDALSNNSEIFISIVSDQNIVVSGTDDYKIGLKDLEKFSLSHVYGSGNGHDLTDKYTLYLDVGTNAIKLAEVSNVVSVTLNGNSGEGTETAPYKVVKNQSATLPSAPFSRTGYIFAGWNTTQNGSGGTSYADGATITVSEDMTLYAQWIELPDDAITMEYGSEKNLPETEGVELSGWTSDNPDVVQIEGDKLKAVGVGETTITANAALARSGETLTVNVTVTPMPITFGSGENENPGGTITYQYTGEQAPPFSQFATFYPATIGDQTVTPNTNSGAITLTEGTDMVFNYDAGGGANDYAYLPVNVTAESNTETGLPVTVKLLNENYRFVTNNNPTPSETITLSVAVTHEGLTESNIQGLGQGALSFTYDGTGKAAVTGLTGISADNISEFTLHFHPWGNTEFTEQHLSGTANTLTDEAVANIAPKEPGTYLMIISGKSDNHYTYRSWIFTINKATVAIKADDKTIYVGDNLPEWTYTVSGLANGESLTTLPAFTCSTTNTNTAGTYTITPSGAAVPNTDRYNDAITYQTGTLTILNRSGGGSSSGGSSSSNVSGSGDDVSISASGGTVTDAQMESAVKKADKGSTITIKATSSTTVTLPVGGMADAADNDNDVLLDLRYGEVTLSARAIAGMTDGVSSNDKIKVSVANQTSSKDEAISDLLDKGAAVFDVTVEVDGVEIHSFDGTLTITLTVSNLSKISDPHVLHILANGTKEYYAPDRISGNTITVTGIRNLSTFAVIPGSEVPQTNPFTDVRTSDYYYDAVLWAADNGVTGGTSATTFSPNVTVTRAQMVTFLWRAHGSPKATGANPFTDVSTSDYYYDAVLWAVANGVTSGTSADTFGPDAAVTRAQAVTFQWRAAGSPVVSGSSFDDVAADAYYVNAVTWAVANGITNGTGGNTFSPDVVVSRAQAVTFLYRELG